MALSKRLRFEVMRRDNHTCRYCGGHAPDVALTVDHVVPVALGGNDEPSNLVTACKDCNAGKTSSSPDAATVANVADDALRWAEAMKVAAAEARKNYRAEERYRKRFLTAWERYTDWQGYSFDLDDNWRSTVGQWYSAGLPIELVEGAVDRAMAKYGLGKRDKFRYLAGICWRRLTDLQEAARAAVAPPQPETCGWCGRTDCDYIELATCVFCDGSSRHVPAVCHAADDGYLRGWKEGRRFGDPILRALAEVVDGIEDPWRAKLQAVNG